MTTPANSVPAVIWPSKTPNTVLASVTAPTSELMTASFGLFCRFPRQRGRFEFIPRFLGLHLRRSREAGESLGRVDVRDDAVAVHLDLDDQLGMGGDHVAGADIPGNARELRKRRLASSTGLPRLPRRVGTQIARPSSALKAAMRRSISLAATLGMSPRQTTAPSVPAGSAAKPCFSEVDRPCA